MSNAYPPSQGPNNNPDTSQLVTVWQNAVIALNAILQAIKTIFPQGTGTSATATGGVATLPANPAGFMNVTLPNGTQAKVPYYNP